MYRNRAVGNQVTLSSAASASISSKPTKEEKDAVMDVLRWFAARKRAVIIVVTVALSLPLFFWPSVAARTAGVALMMGSFWIFGVVHLAVTSLLPAVLFPLLGIADSNATAASYFNDSMFLFFGGFLLAIAMVFYPISKYRKIIADISILTIRQSGTYIVEVS